MKITGAFLRKKGYKKLARKIEAIEDQEQQTKVLKFFKQNPYPNDEAIHNFAESIGVDVHKIETVIYSLLTDFIKGVGKHIDTPDSNFDSKELAAGIKIEMEHTGNAALAKEIAKDHLSEPGLERYYTLLQEMEAKAKEAYKNR